MEKANIKTFMYNSFNSWGWLDTFLGIFCVKFKYYQGHTGSGSQEAMTGVDVVYHLAALIAIPFSYQAPAPMLQRTLTAH